MLMCSSWLPGLGHQTDLLRSPLTVLAHAQLEGQKGAVLDRRRRSFFYILTNLHLHILQSGVVHHHKALLTAYTNRFNSDFREPL